MHYNYDLTIIVPGIRNEKWVDLYYSASRGVKKHTAEFIFSGPHALPPELQQAHNVKYIKNFGTPTRALHLATLIAEGRFFTWLSDDAWVYENSIDLAMGRLLENNPQKDIVAMRYCEGENHSGGCPPDAYWTAGYHPDLHAPAVNREWRCPCVMLIAQERYKELGGLDHRFLHINMNVHDLAFRAQHDKSVVHLSPTLVMNCDWDSKRNAQNSNIIAAFFENDRPLFHKVYDGTIERPIKIDPENWREIPANWDKRNY